MDPNQHVGDGGLTMGDNVRMRDTELTRALGIAGKIGSVYGETKPSTSGVEVLGELSEDFAVAVRFDDLELTFWFPADLVEFVDHGAGLTIRIGNTEYIRDADGHWHLIDPK
jgi:hypothetical protein